MKLYTELSTLSTGARWGKTVYSCTPTVAMEVLFLEKTNNMMPEKADIL